MRPIMEVRRYGSGVLLTIREPGTSRHGSAEAIAAAVESGRLWEGQYSSLDAVKAAFADADGCPLREWRDPLAHEIRFDTELVATTAPAVLPPLEVTR